MYTKEHILSVGLKSEFLLFKHISEILPRENYLVVRTPQNPKYVSANFVLFNRPPKDIDEIEKWSMIFQEEFSANSDIRHVKLVWDSSGPNNKLENLSLKDDFLLEQYRTLINNELSININKINKNVDVREIENDEEWKLVIDDQMIFKPKGLSENYYREFSQQLMHDYKSLISMNKSLWYGAFLGSKLVGSLGILWSDGMIAFQRVVVKPDFQRLGICKTMLHHVSRQQLDAQKNLVILAERDSVAEHLYSSLGFKAKEELLAIYRYPT